MIRYIPNLKGKVGIEKNGSSIGIDFKWKENSLPEILTQLSREYGFIDFGLFKKGHKCNFDIKYKSRAYKHHGETA